jgi:signal transduction histidine kinase
VAGAAEARAEPPAAAGTRARILWADDNSDMRDYVRRLLASRYDVIAVPDGLAALDRARAEPPDLVLSDVMMPGLDGFGLLRELRADPATRTVPVILLSARAGEESAVEGLAAGADDYLVKPFAARELLARVRTHLELSRLRRESALEVERANHELAVANRELERANRELEAFSYSVSHDLRGPLRSIDGFTRVLRDRAGMALDETSRRYLERVCAATGRMSDLIDDLLNLARVSRAALCRERLDLAGVAREIVSELCRREPERRVRVSIAGPLEAHADPVLITCVLENLLGNAWKFSSAAAAPEIVFERRSIGGEEVFVVRDNGAGFDMEYANKLFEPFSRLHSQSEFAGTGIGLSIVQRVVARHGGRIWVDAAVGRGATFFFTLGGESS